MALNDSRWRGAILNLRAILILIVFLACYIIFIIPFSSYGKDARITDLVIAYDASHVTVYARAINCFTEKMESAILAGVPTTFTFVLELYKERKYWFDKKTAGVVIKQTIKYDNVKKLFYVTSPTASQPSHFQDFDHAKKAMAELNGVVIASIGDLQKDNSYYIKIKAKLDTMRLPMNLEYVLFFVSLWDFETDWYQQKLVNASW